MHLRSPFINSVKNDDLMLTESARLGASTFKARIRGILYTQPASALTPVCFTGSFGQALLYALELAVLKWPD